MAPSNVLSMAQLRTLPLADQIKILMKNGGCSLDPSPRNWGQAEDQGLRPEAPALCLELPSFIVPSTWWPLKGRALRTTPTPALL